VIPTLGPLGKGFDLPPPTRRARPPGRPPVLVAGGIGIAIFPFLADALLRRGTRPLLLFGARSARDLVTLDHFRARRVPMRVATEDGSRGVKGHVTRLLEPLLADGGAGGLPRLYVCGPTPMLRAVAGLALAAGAPCELALESHMPCGIGVCLGCVVRGRGPVAAYRRVCTEGPVFAASAVAP
jgi:dihydroorotate dehydrogenase electron transfer subunit